MENMISTASQAGYERRTAADDLTALEDYHEHHPQE